MSLDSLSKEKVAKELTLCEFRRYLSCIRKSEHTSFADETLTYSETFSEHLPAVEPVGN